MADRIEARICPKCGGSNVGISYRRWNKDLNCHCRTCDYEWSEVPNDAKSADAACEAVLREEPLRRLTPQDVANWTRLLDRIGERIRERGDALPFFKLLETHWTP